jgi:thiol:disulfide interchange protein DsbC
MTVAPESVMRAARVAAACVLIALGMAAAPARADEAQIREALRTRLPPAMVIQSVAKSPIEGLYQVMLDGEAVYTDEKAEYFFDGRIFEFRTLAPTTAIERAAKSQVAGLHEVVLDGEIVYTDDKSEYFFGGDVFDIRTLPPRNLTEGRRRELTARILSDARELAIRRVNGAGSRVLFTFEDPNCSFCKALHREIAKLDNLTVYIFLMPILSEDSVQKAHAVWCAKDRARAWDELMAKGIVPGEGSACPHPLDRIAALARRFQVAKTPTIFLGDGTPLGGYRSAADIEKAFGAAR